MDAVKEDVNWSATACRAFEARLAEIASKKKEKKDMQTVVHRLRESKLKSNAGFYPNFREIGREWAERWAEYDQLVSLDMLRKSIGSIEDWVAWFQVRDVASHRLAQILLDPPAGREDWDTFWAGLAGIEDGSVLAPHGENARDFVDGALEVWQEVEDRI